MKSREHLAHNSQPPDVVKFETVVAISTRRNESFAGIIYLGCPKIQGARAQVERVELTRKVVRQVARFAVVVKELSNIGECM